MPEPRSSAMTAKAGCRHSSGMLHCSDARAGGRLARIYLIKGESKDIVSVSEAIRGPGGSDNLCFNLCFGGSDLRQLFLCCLDGVYSVRLKVPGAHLLVRFR